MTSRKWTAGDEWNAGTINEISDELQLLLRPPEVLLQRSTTQTITTAGTNPYPMTAIVFDTAVTDELGMWGPDGDLSAIQMPVAGWWDISYGVSWTSTSTTLMVSVALSANGTLADDSTSSYVSPSEISRGEMRNLYTTASYRAIYKRRHPEYFKKDDILRLRMSATETVSTETTAGFRPTLRARWASY